MVTVISLCAPAFAAALPQKKAAVPYTITVNDKTLDLGKLPLAPYTEGDTIMVPLRMIGEALGYEVNWNSETKAITIDDHYIQRATLFNGTATVIFKGELQIIDMSREVQNTAKTVIHNGYTYVPLQFFREFFNDTTVTGNVIMIAPSKSELQAKNATAAIG
jgi:hypothetical protein